MDPPAVGTTDDVQLEQSAWAGCAGSASCHEQNTFQQWPMAEHCVVAHRLSLRSQWDVVEAGGSGHFFAYLAPGGALGRADVEVDRVALVGGVDDGAAQGRHPPSLSKIAIDAAELSTGVLLRATFAT